MWLLKQTAGRYHYIFQISLKIGFGLCSWSVNYFFIISTFKTHPFQEVNISELGILNTKECLVSYLTHNFEGDSPN